MCGICGFTGFDIPIDNATALIGAMCDVIVHRGPDEEGYFIENGIALGMRRLKIIDLTSGSQPIFNEDKSVVVVFNGEIYNFPEIRQQLEKKGHTFYTNTDTEVIVHLYEDCGEEFPAYLNGMFAIAVWDKKCNKLILARDRMGEKPLHYAKFGEQLIFGSEIKSILCHPSVTKATNDQAIYHYFSFHYIPAPLTVYQGITKLLPGEMAIFQNGVINTKKYWQPRIKPATVYNEDEIKERLYEKLYHAVKLRLISDVPLGAFLSGGIDSSIMVALMSRINATPIKTFSIGLENESHSELPFARAVAEQYGTEHSELIIKPDAINLLDRICWHFDEPFGDSSALPTYLVSQMTRQHVKVAISGDGGDELFAGYNRYKQILDRAQLFHRITALPAMLCRTPAGFIGDMLPFGFKGKAFLQSLKYDNFSLFSIGNSEDIKSELFSADFLMKMEKENSFQIAEQFHVNASLLDQCMLFDIQTYLPDDILTKVDRMSMANSLEARAPFLDHNFVEFALTIPKDLKLRNNVTKYILKKTFEKDLPKMILDHKKTGFSIPLDEWFKKDLRELVFDTLTKKTIEKTGVLSYRFVEKLLSQHMSGRRNHKRLIWMILMFELWHQNWMVTDHPTLLTSINNRKLS